jgi:PIN domain nuclease of toxin-antitoxin system
MVRVLLDTHSLLWSINDLAISRAAELAILNAQDAGSLYVSPISAWEIGVASGKKQSAHRPHLRDLPPDMWFRNAVIQLKAELAPFTMDIASESARVPSLYGSGDPGDCFLVATAHIENLTLVTRDNRILKFAKKNPHYLTVIAC